MVTFEGWLGAPSADECFGSAIQLLEGDAFLGQAPQHVQAIADHGP